MKIAVLGINYYPEITGIGVYTTGMCEYLASKGHEVTAFTSFPYYPFGADFSSWYKERGVTRHSFFFDEEINGVKIIRCNHYKPRKPGALKRILHETSFTLLMLARTLSSSEKYDLIIYVSPPFLLGLVTIIFSRLKKAPYILHVQDMVVDAAKELRMIKNKTILSILENIERYIYAKADFITTISEAMRHRIIEKGAGEGKTGLFLNWANACFEEAKKFSKKNRKIRTTSKVT